MLKRMVFILVLLIPLFAIAQTFTATVDETTVGDNQQFQISFTLSGQNLKGVRNLKPPSFSDFMALSGPSQSTNIQFINGVQSASYSYSYILRAKRIGVFTIGKASIEFNGKLYETEPIKITVVKGSSLPKQKKKDGEISNEEIAKNLFIRAIVNKRKVFLGEQVTVVYKLYTRLNIAAQMSINKLPQYQGFWTEELESSNNITFSTEMIDGKQFRVGTLKRAALFPTQTGKLEITPFELTVPIQLRRNRNRNNFFDDFFNDPFGASQTVKYNATSNKVTINVLPLPATGKPESFNGAVGDFTLNAGIDKTTAKTNESMTLKVSISGKGNLELLKLPKLDLPAGFEKYEPKTSENINRKNVISGKKTAEYLMIPRVVGKREIPPVEFSYFNPEKKKYFTLRSKSFALNITQGEKLIETEFTSKENILKLGSDIRFIKTSNDDIYEKEESILFTTFFWAGGIVPVILLLVLVGWKRKNDKLAGNLSLLHYQRARKVAKSRLKKAKKLIQENNYTEFYTEISLALFGYLEDKFHIPKAEFTIEKAADELRNAGVEETLIETVKKTAEDCEFVRFSPGAEKDSAMQSRYDQVAVVIVDVEKNIAEGNGK
ncbi:MAG: BatD family protein [Ignavibacteria bacterium]|nr:BatD family protein [Ignavibacteria bacterium]